MAKVIKKTYKKLLSSGKALTLKSAGILEQMLPHNSLPRLVYLKEFARQKQTQQNPPVGFSLVMTTRNRKQFLSWAVAAVIANTQEPFEIIIMDNASDDGTQELGLALEQKYPAVIRYVRLNRNYGTNAYALGFLRAQYQYLVDMDDDVLALSAGWDKATIKAFNDVPRLGFLAMNVVQDKYTNGAKPDAAYYSDVTYSDTTIAIGPPGGWFAVTTRAIYNEVGGFVFKPYKPFHLEDGLFAGAVSNNGYLSGLLKKKFIYHASGQYWNAAYGYNRIWKEKYRRDYKEFLQRILDVKIDDVPTAEYARTIMIKTEQQHNGGS